MTRPEFTAKVATIQATLNAPKGQLNSFGGYRYRSAEDILTAVKPLLSGLILSISDEILLIGDRFYVKATATITDGEHEQSTSALAREPLNKKGADESQITGMASSYARKYALNGLFAIDDAKDADTDEHARQNGQQPRGQQRNQQQQRQQRPQNQQQRPQGGNQQQGQQQGQQQQQRPPASPETILKALEGELAKVHTKAEVDALCNRAWKALNGNKDAQPKVHQARNNRLTQINQTQQAA